MNAVPATMSKLCLVTSVIGGWAIFLAQLAENLASTTQDETTFINKDRNVHTHTQGRFDFHYNCNRLLTGF